MTSAYSGLLDIIDSTARDTQIRTIHTGVVQSLKPLMIQTGGILLTAEDLLINERLMEKPSEFVVESVKGELTGKCSGCGSGGDSTVSWEMENGSCKANLTQMGVLTVGCRVVMVTANNDIYIVLCKVVSI